MSQVDYLHFFNNIIWTNLQMIILYFLICVIIVQGFQKVLRLRFFVNKYLVSFSLDDVSLNWYINGYYYIIKNNIKNRLKSFKISILNYIFIKIKKWSYE